jgi:hypothetical protein
MTDLAMPKSKSDAPRRVPKSLNHRVFTLDTGEHPDRPRILPQQWGVLPNRSLTLSNLPTPFTELSVKDKRRTEKGEFLCFSPFSCLLWWFWASVPVAIACEQQVERKGRRPKEFSVLL